MSGHRHVTALRRPQRSHLAFSAAITLLLAALLSLGGVLGAPGSGAAGLVPVSPVVPSVTQSTCLDGAATAPQVVLPTTTGITYTISNPDPAPGEHVVVSAVPDAGYTLADPLTDGYTPGSAGSASWDIVLDSPTCGTEVTPVAPEVTQSSCVNGSPTDPTVTPATTTGIDYTVDNAAPQPGDTVTVTATPTGTNTLVTPLPQGWQAGPAGTASYDVVLSAPTCDAIVTPVAPTVTPSTCVNGTPSDPSVTPATTPGITYTVDNAAPQPGDTVTVTATPDAGSALVSPLPNGWTAGPGGSATYPVTLPDAPACTTTTTATPAAPTVTPSTCVNGTPSDPSVTPATTPGITYTVDNAAPQPGDTVTVTATADAGSTLVSPLPNGWTAGQGGTADYTVTVPDAPTCTTTTAPVAPAVAQSSCVDGAAGTPTVTPATTTGIDYTVDNSAPQPGDTVTVTATPAPGYDLVGALPDGWTTGPGGSATYTVTLTTPDCSPGQRATTPVAPTVQQSSCLSQKPTTPSVTPATTPGIDHTVDNAAPKPGDTVVVTATPQAGFTLASPLPDGWLAGPGGTATYTVVLVDPVCSTTTVSPTAPAVTQSTCVTGVATQPLVTPVATTGITYATDKPLPLPGEVVVVTATLDPGYTFAAPLPRGWVAGPTAGTATYSVLLGRPFCSPRTVVRPTKPAVTHSTCVHGHQTTPSVQAATTTGLTYTVRPRQPKPGSTVTVVAAPLTGYALGSPLPKGWSANPDGSARTTVSLDDPTCGDAPPHEPPLPNTGGVSLATLGGGLGLLLAGLAMSVLGFRARSTEARHRATGRPVVGTA